jgi:ADP-heptose:LPS heptosyltransferase
MHSRSGQEQAAGPGALALLRFSSIGDLLLCEPVPRLLKAREPERRLLFVTRERFAEIPRGWPAVDEVLTLPEGAGLRGLLALRADLGRRGAQAIDLHNSLRSRLLLLGRPARRLPKHRLQKWALVHAKFLGRRWPEPPPVRERYLLAAGLEAADDGARPRLMVDGRQLRAGRARHELLAVGATHFTKAWPAEHWLAFAAGLLRAVSRPLVIAGGPAEADLGARLEALDPGRIENHCGRQSLSGTAHLVADAARILVGDTGLLHMADGAGVPGLALFGSSVRELGFWPTGAGPRVLEVRLPCRPCSHVGRASCPAGHFRCLRELTAERVLAAYLETAPAGGPCPTSEAPPGG